MNGPTIAPMNPPLTFPNTPDVAPKKKCGTSPGRITAAIAPPECIPIEIAIPINPPANDAMNPIRTALGA